MPPRRIAIYLIVFLVVPAGLGWFLIRHLDDLPESWRSKLPLRKRPLVAATSVPFTKETQALMSALEGNLASPKARRLLEEARKNPRPYLIVLSETVKREDAPAERLAAVRFLPALASAEAVSILQENYPLFMKDPGLRKEAVKSLTLIHGFGAVDALLAAVRFETESAIRKQILESLALLAEEKDVPRLKAVLSQVEGVTPEEIARIANAPGNRRASTDAILEIHGADLTDPKVRERLRFLMLHGEGATRTASIQKLARSGVPEAVRVVADWAATVSTSQEEERRLVEQALSALAREPSASTQKSVEEAFQARRPQTDVRWKRYQELQKTLLGRK